MTVGFQFPQVGLCPIGLKSSVVVSRRSLSVCHSKLSTIGDRLPISGLSTDVKMAAVMVTDVSLFVYFLWFSPRR